MKLRTWGLALRRIEDFAVECGGEAVMFDRLCEFVTGGGYITDLCGKYAIDREVLLAWVRKDPERDRRWRQAEADRKEAAREEVLALWGDVLASTPVGAPEWKDVIKVSELAARHAGVLRDGPGVTVNAGAGSLIAILTAMDAVGQGAGGDAREPIDVTPTVEQREEQPVDPRLTVHAENALHAPTNESAAPPDDTGCESSPASPPTPANLPATASVAPRAVRPVYDESLLV